MIVISRFGLESNVAPAPLSLIYSILLLIGVYVVGYLISRFLIFGKTSNNVLPYCLAPVVGAASLSLVCFPLALLGFFPRSVAASVACVVISIAIIGFLVWTKRVRNSDWLILHFQIRSVPSVLIIFLLIGYFLLSLGPTTEADSLDYHIGVALHVLNFGDLRLSPEWFHSRLSGSGEILIAIGLAIGAEQFGALLQVSGIFSIVALFIFLDIRPLYARRWFALLLLSTPLLIAWTSSPKPYLLPISMTTIALALTHLFLSDPESESDGILKTKIFFTVCLLAMTASTMKLNFMLSGLLICALAGFLVIRAGHTMIFLKVAPVLFLFTVAPFCVWRSLTFGGGLFEGFYTAFPGNWPGASAFEAALRVHPHTFIGFVNTLFFPPSLGAITTSVGLLAFSILFVPKLFNSSARGIGVIAVTSFIVSMLVGQWSSRFFFEPLCWVVLGIYLSGSEITFRKHLSSKLFKASVTVQSLLAVCAISYGVFCILPGGFSDRWRSEVMTKFANGYDIFRWVDQELPAHSTVISMHRSVALAPRNVIASDWMGYVDLESKGRNRYLEILADKQPDFILLVSEKNDSNFPDLCVAEKFAGPFVAKVATRNPFNTKQSFNAWLHRIDRDCLSNPTR